MDEQQASVSLGKLRRQISELKSAFQELEQSVSEFEWPVPTSPPSEEQPAPPLDLASAERAVSRFSNCPDQGTLLQTLVGESRRYADRVILFLAGEGGQWAPYFGLGIPEEQWRGIRPAEDDPIHQASQSGRIVEMEIGSGPRWVNALASQGRAMVLPMTFRDKVPVTLFVQKDSDIDIDSLQMLLQLARLSLQNQYLGLMLDSGESAAHYASRWPTLESLTATEQPEPEPSLRIGDDHSQPAPTDTALESELSPAAETILPLEPASEVNFGDRPSVREEVEGVYELESLANLTPEDLGLTQEEFERLMGQASSDWTRPGEEGLRVKDEIERLLEVKSSFAGRLEDPLTFETVAPVGPDSEPETGATVQEVAASDGEEARDEALHEEARRFARLLVAEIKLYNEAQIESGRQAGDLFARLGGDISRSRQMYEKRAHPDVKAEVDYLHKEMIRVLAQGEQALMGSDYPGPILAEGS